MNKAIAFVCTTFICLSAGSIAMAADTEKDKDMVEVVPATRCAASDLPILKENNQLILSNQALVKKIMGKERLEIPDPQLPHYNIMSANSVQALLNQLEYSHLARKLGAKMPPRPDLETGSAVKNNRFLQDYNNALLRSVAEKLEVKMPAAIDLKNDSLVVQDNKIIKQNGELLNSIAIKLGVSK